MQNLAGDARCGSIILKELEEADIEIIRHNWLMKREVPASITGILFKNGDVEFTFIRAGYYWMVYGEVSLRIAKELYADPVGKKDVRVAGYCHCPSPEWYTEDDGFIRCVSSYHIDSQEGLNFFVQTLKKYKLVD